MGVEVTEVEGGEWLNPDCPVSVWVDVTGESLSSEYMINDNPGNLQTCWSGMRLDGSLTVALAGTVTGTGAINENRPPPMQVEFCNPTPGVATGPAIRDALLFAFGLPAEMTASAAWGAGAHFIDGEDPLFGVAALDAVLAGVYHPDERVREVALYILKYRFAESERLTPAEVDSVPALIAALDHFVGVGMAVDSLQQALGDLFEASRGTGRLPDGFDEDCPAHWWLLSLDEWEPSAPCDHLGDL